MGKKPNYIRKTRKELDLSLTDMAYFTGIPLERIDEIERGVVLPTDNERETIGSVLRIDLYSEEYLGNKVYMQVTQDELALPVAVANTPRELAEMLGVPYETVNRGCSRGKHCKHPKYVAASLEG